MLSKDGVIVVGVGNVDDDPPLHIIVADESMDVYAIIDDMESEGKRIPPELLKIPEKKVSMKKYLPG